MTPETKGTCETCGAGLVSSYAWRKLSAPERERLRGEGFQRQACLGECTRCRQARYAIERTTPRRRTGTDKDIRSQEEVMADWEFLVDRSKTLTANTNLLAPRMGMSVTALKKALERAGVKGWPTTEAGWAARRNDEEWAS